MGARGPAPKDPEKRVRRNKEVRTTLPAKPPVKPAAKRTMPPAPPLIGEWSTFTQRWWDSWCGSAQASRFTEPAWRRLELIAAQVELYWRTSNPQHLPEIRMTETALGALPMDLSRLRWDLSDEAAPEATASPDELSKWRTRRRVADGTG